MTLEYIIFEDEKRHAEKKDQYLLVVFQVV